MESTKKDLVIQRLERLMDYDNSKKDEIRDAANDIIEIITPMPVCHKCKFSYHTGANIVVCKRHAPTINPNSKTQYDHNIFPSVYGGCGDWEEK